MAVFPGPEIVNEGLIFYYDMNNIQKSWKGAPVTNLAKNASNQIDWSVGNLTQAVTRSTVVDNEIYRITSTSGTGTSFRIRFNNATLTNGATYTISYKYKIISGGPTFVANDWCDTAITRTTTEISSGIFYETASGTRATYDSTYRFLDFEMSNNTVVEIWDLQLEERSFATPYSSAQVRSNTQSILDLANRHTITVPSLVYTSTNTFSYNGSTSYCYVSPYVQSLPNSFTVEAWINSTEHSSDGNVGKIIVMCYGAYNGWIFSLVGTNSIMQLRHHNFNTTSTSYNVVNPSGLSLNTWYHIAAVDNGSTVRLYVNGNQVASGASITSTTNSPMNLNIGAWPGASTSTYFKGSIPMLKIYHKALSANEIRQNFNSSRGRYAV